MRVKRVAAAALTALIMTGSAVVSPGYNTFSIEAEAVEYISSLTTYKSGYSYLELFPGTKGNLIYFTTNGKAPTTQSNQYTKKLKFLKNTTVMASEFDKNGKKISSCTVNVEVRCGEPVISYKNNNNGTAKVTIKSDDKDVKIYYTLNGKDPVDKAKLYKKSFNVKDGTVVKAIAVKSGCKSSKVSTAEIKGLGSSSFKADKYIKNAIKLTNEARAEKGLEPLVIDAALCEAASIRAKETAKLFDKEHYRPDGTKFYTVLNEVGFKYAYASENIGYTAGSTVNVKRIVQNWINSPVHYSNMLNKKGTLIGIGYYIDGDYCYWVQEFGERL